MRVLPKLLDVGKPTAYSKNVPETTGNRGESRNYRRRISAARRFFFVRTSSIAFNGRALVGVRLRTPVAFCAGLSTLLCARPPCLRAGRWVYQPTEGGRIMRPAIPARPEQQQSPLEIIRNALRAAALAPNADAALDVTGAALVRLADLAKAEVRHD
jgi:hypothetical protein